MRRCCVVIFVLLLLMLCCGSTQACEWLLVVPGRETQVVEVFPGEGGYLIAVGEGALVIWEAGKPDAQIRFGRYTYRGKVGLSYPENYCGAVMLQITENTFVDYWIDF